MKNYFLYLVFICVFSQCSSSDSDSENVTIIPLAPTNLTGEVISGSQINLVWSDNSTNEIGFKVERKTITGTFVEIGNTTTNITTFNDTGLTQNTSYTYRIYSYNSSGNSPNYSNEITLVTLNTTALDLDGNIYPLVTICGKTWSRTNLNVSRYKNGEIIPQVTSYNEWLNSTNGAWCYFENNSTNGLIYGKIYNWYAINDPRGLAPEGYHIPSETEWNELINCLDVNANGGSTTPNIAGGKMKSTGTSLWTSPNTGATNESGFTGLPGGYRSNGGQFFDVGGRGYWWSSTQFNQQQAWTRHVNNVTAQVNKFLNYKNSGFYVRFVKN
jgi:uncharacterized protein (TIGR02145 family)